MANQGIYTDTRIIHGVQFYTTEGVALPLEGSYSCSVYMRGNPTPVFVFNETDGTLDASLKAVGKLTLNALPSQHQPELTAGLYRLHLKRVDSVDNYFAAQGEMLVGNPGDQETYIRFENASDGSTAQSYAVAIAGPAGTTSWLGITDKPTGFPASDGDKSDVTVSGAGTVYTVKNHLRSYATRATVIATNLSSLTTGQAIYVRGHTTEGVGGATYIKLAAAPSPVKAWHLQSSDGGYFEADDQQIGNPLMLGAVGDGVADDTAAIQAAFDRWRAVQFSPGTYKYSALTLNNWQHVMGAGFCQGAAPSNASVILKSTATSGNTITCGNNPIIEKIYLWGAGVYNETTKALGSTTATAIKLTDDIVLENVSFALFQSAVRFGPSSYYVKTRNVEFNRCTNGYVTDGSAPYDIHIDAPVSRLTQNFFAGQTAFPARNIKIFGGSIEGFSSIASGFLDFSMFGTYTETIVERDGAFAIDPGVNGCSVSLFGCTVYLNHIARFVNLSGLSNAQLGGYGNVYDGAGRAAGIIYYLPSTGAVNLSGDRFGAGHPNNLIYVDSISNAAKFNGITIPLLPAANSFIAYSGMQFIGSRGFIGLGLTSAPSSPATGMTVMADGSSWDPLARAAGRPYWATWQGDRWRSPDGGV